MASAGSLIFELAADVAHLRTDMKQANDIMTSSLRGIQNVTNALGIKMGADMAINLGRAFAANIQAAIDKGDQLGKLADRIGTTTEALSGLQYAAQFAGVSTDDLTTGFKGLNKALLDARNPASDSAAAIRALGLNVQALTAMDPTRAFDEIAEAFSGFSNGAEKAAVATQLFGKQGQALIPLLNGGKEGLQAAREEAERLGLIMSSNTAQAMSDLNDNLTRLSNVSQGAYAVIAQQLVPALDTLVTTLFSASQEGTTYNNVLIGIGTIISDLIIDITGLAGEISIAWRELQGYGAAVSQFFAGNFRDAIQTTRDAMAASNRDMDALTQNLSRAKGLQREMASSPIDFGNRSSGWDEKPVLRYTAALDANAAAQKRAKKEVDEYANMLKTLQEELRRTQTSGDDMLMLLTDPKFLQMTKAQQDNLRGIKEETLALAQAQQQEKETHDAQKQAWADTVQQAQQAQQALSDWADTQLDSIDPMRELNRQLDLLNAAYAEGKIVGGEYAEVQALILQKYDQAVEKTDPMKKQLDELKDAMLGFGKRATDSFVDFISGAGDASQSFGEMTASILRDIAKMLVYKNIIEPLFSSIGGGAGGFGSFFSGLFGGAGGMSAPAGLSFGGNRMAGGHVSPGQFYSVNETPLHGEVFSPNVPGTIRAASDVSGGVLVNVYITQSNATQDVSADTAEGAEFGRRIGAAVRQVIATEKRAGGLLAT
jgi:hypothetical protein